MKKFIALFLIITSSIFAQNEWIERLVVLPQNDSILTIDSQDPYFLSAIVLPSLTAGTTSIQFQVPVSSAVKTENIQNSSWIPLLEPSKGTPYTVSGFDYNNPGAIVLDSKLFTPWIKLRMVFNKKQTDQEIITLRFNKSLIGSTPENPKNYTSRRGSLADTVSGGNSHNIASRIFSTSDLKSVFHDWYAMSIEVSDSAYIDWAGGNTELLIPDNGKYYVLPQTVELFSNATIRSFNNDICKFNLIIWGY
jgi:hypothetical protein